MPADFTQSIVEVTGHTQSGTGFVVAEDLIVTCAHVVGTPDYTPTVRFYANKEQTMDVPVIRELWRGEELGDIAVLRLKGTVPAGVTPLRLGRSTETKGHVCRALGYPDLKEVVGVLGEGRIRGRVTDKDGRSLIQLTSLEITDGFSGAPLLDDETGRIVGMIVLVAEKLPQMAFAIPAETLHTLLQAAVPGLQLPPPRR